MTDAGKIGEVFVTGLGLPSEMAGHVDSGAVKSFAIWNPIDLGYSAATMAYNLIQDPSLADSGSIPIGRMGTVELDDDKSGAMSDPFVYDASNVNDFKDIF